jgi:hypothetical protein
MLRSSLYRRIRTDSYVPLPMHGAAATVRGGVGLFSTRARRWKCSGWLGSSLHAIELLIVVVSNGNLSRFCLSHSFYGEE